MNNVLGMDFTGVEAKKEYELMPLGYYNVVIYDADLKLTKNAIAEGRTDESMVALKLEVVDGDYKGRKLFDNINVRNRNPDTQRWAHETMKMLLDALELSSNILHTQPLDVLLSKPLTVKVGLNKAKDGNNVMGYFKYGTKQVAKEFFDSKVASASNANNTGWPS